MVDLVVVELDPDVPSPKAGGAGETVIQDHLHSTGFPGGTGPNGGSGPGRWWRWWSNGAGTGGARYQLVQVESSWCHGGAGAKLQCWSYCNQITGVGATRTHANNQEDGLLAVVVVSSPGVMQSHHQMREGGGYNGPYAGGTGGYPPRDSLLTETEDLEPVVVVVVEQASGGALHTLVVMVDQVLSWFVIKSQNSLQLQKQLVVQLVSMAAKPFIHFVNSGTFTTPGAFNETVEYIIVAGGGGGGVMDSGSRWWRRCRWIRELEPINNRNH